MTYETDAADAQLFEDGDIAGLLAKYNDIIVGRCVARLRGGPDAEDVAQNVRLRLLSEFHRGKRYGGLPYRVVVHQVITWTIGDVFGPDRAGCSCVELRLNKIYPYGFLEPPSDLSQLRSEDSHSAR